MWKYFFIFALCGLSGAEDVEVSLCDNVGEQFCEVKDLKISPCKESPKACAVKRGGDAAIEFNYVPKFNATAVAAMAFHGLAPFPGMDGEACKYTSCPLVAGQSNRQKQSFHIDKNFPKGTFLVQWHLWNVEESDEKCCFEFVIRLK